MRLVGRKIECCHCGEKTVKGAARVMRFVLFFFCRDCWRNHRGACEAQMRAATGIEEVA